MKSVRVYAIGAALLIIATVAAVWWTTTSPRAISVSTPIVQQDAYWTALIKLKGGETAYTEFAWFVQRLSPEEQHQEAHIFGGALYEAQGLSGLSICDAQFAFGCFHEFLGRAIAALGLSVVQQLDENCFKVLGPEKGLACEHGIGHGIEVSIGYSADDLRKTLATCKTLSHNEPIGGCYAGAFMEYDLQTMLGTQGRVREISGNDMQFPCDAVSVEYKKSCYFSQPQWWYQRFRADGLSDVKNIYMQTGALCAQVPDAYARDCYEGIGTNIPAAVRFSPDLSRGVCESVSSDPADVLYCKSLAANAIFSAEGNNTHATDVCAGLTEKAYAYCDSYARNQANILNEAVLPATL